MYFKLSYVWFSKAQLIFALVLSEFTTQRLIWGIAASEKRKSETFFENDRSSQEYLGDGTFLPHTLFWSLARVLCLAPELDASKTRKHWAETTPSLRITYYTHVHKRARPHNTPHLSPCGWASSWSLRKKVKKEKKTSWRYLFNIWEVVEQRKYASFI